MSSISPNGAEVERTYGNWRKPRSPGVGNLGLLGTAILMGGLIVAVILTMFSLLIALGWAAVLAAVLLPLVVKDKHGRSMMQRGTGWLAWRRGVASGAHIYRSGPLGLAAHGTCKIPGLAAASTLHEARDSYNRPFAMIRLRGHYTVVFSCGADGAALVDQDQVDTWVAYWGGWLANLANEPGLIGAQVTVETAPDTGARLRAEVEGQVRDSAPALAREVLREVVETYPAGSAQVSVYVAVTYDAATRPGAKRRSVEEMARDLGTRLPGLTGGLGMVGAGEARPMTATELAEMVRVAYDPTAAPLIAQAQRAGGSGITWDDAGPSAAEESWGDYRHDSAWSITWAMSEAPRGEVLSSVLTSLLSPHRDIDRKRVSLLYRPHSPAEAASIVERDRRTAQFRVGGKRMQARDVVALQAAEQARMEEAKGAGVLRFSLLATATVSSRERLPAAAAAIDVLAAPARVRLRRAHGSQATAFAACLPIGLVLPTHSVVPAVIRDAA
jgi:hypothetical protein